MGILGSDDCCAVTCKGISVTCKGILGDVVSCICAGNIQKSLILNDLKHDLIPAPRETTPVVRILTQGSQIGKLFQSIYQINPIVILTRGSQIGKLFRPIYQIDPIVILTQGSQIGKLFRPIYQINPIVIPTQGSQIGKLFRPI